MRYKAVDGASPTWLAVYDLKSPAVLSSAPYKALPITPRDTDVLSRAQNLSRRVYELITTVTQPEATTFPTKLAHAVTILVPPELDEEFNRWYDEEHLPLLAKVPTFQRARRYKLVDSSQLAGPASEAPVHNYLTLHDADTDDYSDRPAFKEAIGTPWMAKVLGAVGGLEARRFALHAELLPLA